MALRHVGREPRKLCLPLSVVISYVANRYIGRVQTSFMTSRTNMEGHRKLSTDEIADLKTSVTNRHVHVAENSDEWFARFSSYDRMFRVVVLVHRFTNKCRRRLVESTPVPCRSELDAVLRIIVLESQRLSFSVLRDEVNRNVYISSKSLDRLCPFVDDEGIICVGGRLRHSPLPYKYNFIVGRRLLSYRFLSVIIGIK